MWNIYDVKTGEFNPINIAKEVVLIVAILIFVPMFIAVVPAGHIGVQDTFGQVNPIGLQAGFVVKLPITAVIPINIQTLKYSAKATAASSDLQDVSAEVTLNYHINPTTVPEIYRKLGLGFEDKVIIPAVQESVKASTARFSAEELITKRPEVKQTIDIALAQRLKEYNIVVETVSITDFSFSDQFTAAIESKVTAQQDALRATNELSRIKVEKEQTITKAEAEAQSIRLRADAEAYALRVIREQLENQSNLIQYNAVNKWDGVMPQYVGMGDALPFIDVIPTQ